MQYFDFHAHIILKQAFEDQPNVDSLIYQSDVGGLPRLCTDLPYIIESQIHQSQLATFRNEVIIGCVLHGIESYLAAQVAPLRNYLKSDSRAKLSETLLQAAASEQYHTFTDFVLTRTLNLYLQAGASFNILTKDSFAAPLPTNKVNVFFSVEGCHSLVDSINRVKSPTEGYDPKEILSNLDVLLTKIKVFTVNITHLQQSNLSNHAFGIQLTDPAPFYPTGNGLTDDGRKVIQGLFDRGVAVDLKHMSYKSRMDLRTSAGFTNARPPMCTHAGFTGVAFKDWPGYISVKKPINGDVLYLEVAKTMQSNNNIQRPGAPAFNMTTINLFNEEIEWIVRSKGMIGLSMDRRILGFVSRFDDRPTGVDQDSARVVDKEYFSKSEWQALGIQDKHIGVAIDDEDCVQISDVEASAENSLPARDEYFYDHVLLHIKHFFQVCVDAGIPVAEAQQHLSIGSDFDGLINPFINTQTCLAMADLKKYIIANLGMYLKNLNDAGKWVGQLDVAAFAEDLFYNNGYRTVKAFCINAG